MLTLSTASPNPLPPQSANLLKPACLLTHILPYFSPLPFLREKLFFIGGFKMFLCFKITVCILEWHVASCFDFWPQSDKSGLTLG